MAKKVKVVLDKRAVVELFKSPEVHSWLQSVGNEVAGAATGMSKGQFAASTHDASFTAIANVYPEDVLAARDNMKNNTLLKALGASGLPKEKPRL